MCAEAGRERSNSRWSVFWRSLKTAEHVHRNEIRGEAERPEKPAARIGGQCLVSLWLLLQSIAPEVAMSRDKSKNCKIKKGQCYVMQDTWRGKKGPMHNSEKMTALILQWIRDGRDAGSEDPISPQITRSVHFTIHQQGAGKKSHCCISVKQMLCNCTLTVQTNSGGEKKRNGYGDFPECRKDRLTSLQHLPSLPILILQGGQAHGYYFCIPTVSTKCNAVSISYPPTHTQTQSSMQ